MKECRKTGHDARRLSNKGRGHGPFSGQNIIVAIQYLRPQSRVADAEKALLFQMIAPKCARANIRKEGQNAAPALIVPFAKNECGTASSGQCAAHGDVPGL